MKFKIVIKFSHKIYKNLDSVIFAVAYHIRQYIVLLRYFANGEVTESRVVS